MAGRVYMCVCLRACGARRHKNRLYTYTETAAVFDKKIYGVGGRYEFPPSSLLFSLFLARLTYLRIDVMTYNLIYLIFYRILYFPQASTNNIISVCANCPVPHTDFILFVLSLSAIYYSVWFTISISFQFSFLLSGQ